MDLYPILFIIQCCGLKRKKATRSSCDWLMLGLGVGLGIGFRFGLTICDTRPRTKPAGLNCSWKRVGVPNLLSFWISMYCFTCSFHMFNMRKYVSYETSWIWYETRKQSQVVIREIIAYYLARWLFSWQMLCTSYLFCISTESIGLIALKYPIACPMLHLYTLIYF